MSALDYEKKMHSGEMESLEATISWAQNDIRNWLNSNFFNGISFKEKILPVIIFNYDNQEYGTFGGPDTTDNIFLLSIEKASWLLPDNRDRQANYDLSEKIYEAVDRKWNVSPEPNAKTDGQLELKHGGSKWVLRSPDEKQNMAARVLARWQIGPRGANVANEIGVRPVFWVSDIKAILDDK